MDELNNEYFPAEWLRIKALTIEQNGNSDDVQAEEVIIAAIARASSQGAKLFELTATMDLVQLQQRHGREIAGEMLRDLIAVFQPNVTFGHLERARLFSDSIAAGA